MANTYQQEALHYSLYTRIVADHVFSILGDIPQGGHLLDAGCGSGYFLQRVHETWPNKWQLHGIECDQRAVECVSRRLPGDYRISSLTHINHPDGLFDLVLNLSVLEHIDDDDKAIDELVRVTKPGGRLIISVPCLNGCRSRSKLRNLGHDDPQSPEYHLRLGYVSGDLAHRLEQKGLRIVRQRMGMYFLSEIIMDLVKWAYFVTSNRLESQTNINDSKRTLSFRIYQKLFPVFYAVERLERLLFSASQRGHILTLEATKPI